jgi:probable phosphoglycerate mutase
VAVVVTHGGTAGRLVERLLGIDPEHRRVLGPLANCAWSELVLHGEHWRLIRHNSSVLQLPAVEGDVPAPRPTVLRAVPALRDDEARGADEEGPMSDADALN